MGHLFVLAPSMSGKSHFADNAHGPYGMAVVDGDDAISATIGWPKDPEWFKAANADSLQSTHFSKLAELGARNEDAICVFNGDPKYAHLVLPHFKWFAVVLLADERYKRNARLRHESAKRGGPHGHAANIHPDDLFMRALRNREKIAAWVKSVKKPPEVFSNWTDLAKRFKLWLPKDYTS